MDGITQACGNSNVLEVNTVLHWAIDIVIDIMFYTFTPVAPFTNMV